MLRLLHSLWRCPLSVLRPLWRCPPLVLRLLGAVLRQCSTRSGAVLCPCSTLSGAVLCPCSAHTGAVLRLYVCFLLSCDEILDQTMREGSVVLTDSSSNTRSRSWRRLVTLPPQPGRGSYGSTLVLTSSFLFSPRSQLVPSLSISR